MELGGGHLHVPAPYNLAAQIMAQMALEAGSALVSDGIARDGG